MPLMPNLPLVKSTLSTTPFIVESSFIEGTCKDFHQEKDATEPNMMKRIKIMIDPGLLIENILRKRPIDLLT